MKAIVLLSGGIDSTSCLARAIRWNGESEILALSFNYGQRHSAELAAAKTIADYYKVEHRTLDLQGLELFRGAKSSQVGEYLTVPHGHYADESMKMTVVPNRNMILLSLAGAVALSLEAKELHYGAHAGDHAIYPDCRPQFVEAMRLAFRKCDWVHLSLVAPYLERTKAEIVIDGFEHGVPYELTYSCYQGGLIHCGKCGTCVERKEAFQDAGVDDPTEYAA